MLRYCQGGDTLDCKFCKRTLMDGIYLGNGIIRCRGCQKENFVTQTKDLYEEPEQREIEVQEARPRKRNR